MKRIAIFAFATFTTLIMTSCANTSSDSGSVSQYPVLNVLSDKPYVWDDSISEALNVARMAQPAGVGNGMRDFADGTQANTGRIGAGMRTFDAGIGLLSQGIFGVIAHESLSQGVNRQVDWKPTIVDLIPVKSVDENNIFKSVQEILGEKVKGSIVADYPNLKWLGSFTLNDKRRSHLFNTDFIFFDDTACRDSYKFSSIDGDYDKAGFPKIPDSNFFEDTSNISKYCELGGLLSIAGKTTLNGEDFYIVTFKIEFGHFFNDALARNYKGYLMMPDYFNFVAVNKPLRITVNRSYAAVYKNGKELLFEKK
ncbi:hypothetical protein [Alishewanella sp. HL-SH06]|uniref:hypothetical protein n=1 Tax=Alishewanella sp. HL-SH06 TaxID=3461144 RepID=UPI004041A5AA